MKVICLVCLTLAIGISKPLSVSLVQLPPPVVTMTDVSGAVGQPVAIAAHISTPYSNIASMTLSINGAVVSTVQLKPQLTITAQQ